MNRRSRIVIPLLLVLLAAPWPAPRHVGAAAPQAGARIVRDPYGVPHIYAANAYDLFYAYGYAMTQDRLAQMELFRRAALGRLAEALGPDMLETDIETRRELYAPEERAAFIESLSPRGRGYLEAYRDGVNARLAEVAADPSLMPYELISQGVSPAPWQVADSVAILQFLGRQFGEFGGAGGNELKNQQLYQYLVATFGRSQGEAIFNDVIWIEDPAAPATIAGPAVSAAASETRGSALRVDDGVLDEVQSRLERVRRAREAHGIPTRLGSYWWAVSASRSETGATMLFGGPQMGHFTPNIVYEVGLHGAGFNVVGISFVGAPGILIGHNGRVAWSVTSAFGDQVDVYVESLHPTDRYRYWYRGGWRTMEQRIETFQVKDGAPVTLEIARTVHGPVVSWDTAAGTALSERRAHWNLELVAWDALLAMGSAAKVEEAMQAVAAMALSYNIVLADQDGHIGYRQAGRQPIRAAGFDRRLPLPGTGQAEWQGFLEPAAMPHVINPSSGRLGNWNNKPMAGWANGDAVNWGTVDRVQRIFDLLEGNELFTAERMKAIAYDIGRHDYRADALLPYLLNALDAPGVSADPRLPQAEQILQSWDQRTDEGAVGESIFDAWRTHVLSETFGDELGDYLVTLQDPINPTGDSLLARVLQGPAASLPVARDYFSGVAPDVALVDSLVMALDDLTRQFGTPDMAEWRWDPGTIDFTEGELTFGSVPWFSRGSYMQFIELTQPRARGENVLPPGESGTLLVGSDGYLQLDPHFLDQLDLYRNWQYKPMPLYYLPFARYLPLIVK